MAKTRKHGSNGATLSPAGLTSKQSNLLAERLNLHPKGLPKVYESMRTRHHVRVDRKTAIAWLNKTFEGQRGISQTRVRLFVAKIREGSWMATPQGIIFDIYDRLIDGQHRLAAFLESGFDEIYLTVTTGALPEHFIHLDEDVGARQLKDLLTSGGLGNSSLASSAFRMLGAYDALQWRGEADRGFISFGHVSVGKWKNNREQAMAWIFSHRSLVEHIAGRLSTSDAKSILRPMSLFSGFYLWVALDDTQNADEFFEKLISGAKLSATDPVFELRRELIKIHTKTSSHRIKTPSFVYGALLIKAWNAFRTEEAIKQLRFNSNENWPKRAGAKRVFKTEGQAV